MEHEKFTRPFGLYLVRDSYRYLSIGLVYLGRYTEFNELALLELV